MTLLDAAPAAPRSPESTRPAPGFAALGVPAPLAEALARQGITTPFPVQAASLPDSLAGRDVLGRGRTGSGKTLAFALPVLARLLGGAPRATRRAESSRPRALVLVPTRELATQVAATFTPLAEAVGLRVTTIFGGVPQGRQVQALRGGVDVVVACPGRLEDLMGQREIRLDQVDVTVLDEADHMADLGFLPAVQRILDATPKGRQRLLFSATLDNGVDRLVRRYLQDPRTHSVDPAVAPVSTMTHHVLTIADRDSKPAVVRELASGTGRRVLFLRTKHAAKKLARQLTASGIPAVDLHGNLSQNARQRNLAAFSGGEVAVLVATDVAARGLHVDDVELVVHVDPPTEHKAYLHRSGRTARAGSGGTVVTLALPEQDRDVRTLMRQAKVTPRTDAVRPGSPVLRDLVGEVAALREWTPPNQREEQPSRPRRSGGEGRGRRPGARQGQGTRDGVAQPSTQGSSARHGARPSSGPGDVAREAGRPGARRSGRRRGGRGRGAAERA
ncbi:DEAD/DEAH box helicase [Aquipuribacter sp. SD81]|uniref:DEAD/DEAH box helicase n=1 Tax=Aquipuribacter sp. SD81 TaxID=3127703 RepID=UPI00301669E5